jgi:hypothetical protein
MLSLSKMLSSRKQTTNAVEDIGQKESSHTVDRNVN